MATSKRVFTLRLPEDVLDKIGKLATKEHRSVTNYIEFVLLQYLEANASSSEQQKRTLPALVSVSGASGKTNPPSTSEPDLRT